MKQFRKRMPEGKKVTNKNSRGRKSNKVDLKSRLQKLVGPLLFGSILLIIIVGAVYQLSHCEPGFRKLQQT